MTSKERLPQQQSNISRPVKNLRVKDKCTENKFYPLLECIFKLNLSPLKHV